MGTKNGAKKRRKKKRAKTGFALLSAEARAELGRRGGEMAVARHRFTKEEASEAGKKGMKIRYARKRKKAA